MTTYGFIKVAAASPKLKVADTEFNTQEIEKIMKEADKNYASVIVFPELCITGYTCGDLFGQNILLDKSIESLEKLLESTKETSILGLVGMPLNIQQRLYNCAIAIQNGRILGVVPKKYIPNYMEFYEKRWFTSGNEISKQISEVKINGQTVSFGNLIFESEELKFSLGVEICEDLWVPIPPSSYHALNGATIIANLSASNELVAKSEYRCQLVSQQSGRCMCGYIYASAGVHESTTDVVLSGHCLIAENGNIIKSSERFKRDNVIVYSEIDVERLIYERQQNKSFGDNIEFLGDKKYIKVGLEYNNNFDINRRIFERIIDSHPFVPSDSKTRDERCQEILNIQVAGLAKRLEHTEVKKSVVGISGGLDSTLALIATVKTFETLGIPIKNIIAVTMPGFGTTDETYNNSIELMKALNVTIYDIDIRAACLQHFKDIEHDLNIHNVIYENTQARERTQILMDIANKVGGIVIGTGDLSELALGWCTYNGDHMSMYGINSSIPKTLVQYLVKWVADNAVGIKTKEVLYKILNTPISPELLPANSSGKIEQKTERIIGPYELHDFFLYYIVRFGMRPDKVLFLANKAFKNTYNSQEIKERLRLFYKRFFSQQFKRSCLPDGPKVGSIGLSPRGDWRMPSDASANIWLSD